MTDPTGGLRDDVPLTGAVGDEADEPLDEDLDDDAIDSAEADELAAREGTLGVADEGVADERVTNDPY